MYVRTLHVYPNTVSLSTEHVPLTRRSVSEGEGHRAGLGVGVGAGGG